MADIDVKELNRQVRVLVGDPDEVKYDFEKEIMPWINAGVREIRKLKPDSKQDAAGDERTVTAVTALSGDVSMDDHYQTALMHFVAAYTAITHGTEASNRALSRAHLDHFFTWIKA